MPPILITLPGHDGRHLILQLFGSQLYKVVGQWDGRLFYPFEKSMTIQEMNRYVAYLKGKVK